MSYPAVPPRLSTALLALAVAACAPSAASTTAPATAAAATPSPAASAAIVPSPTAEPGPVAIADGTYVTDPIPAADLRAAVEADDTLTDDEKTEIIDKALVLEDHETVVVRLVLADGQWTEAKAYDGGAFKVGSRATYAFPDETTVVISEQCCGLTTFTVTVNGAGFDLDPVSGTQASPVDVVASQLIFGFAPFRPAP